MKTYYVTTVETTETISRYLIKAKTEEIAKQLVLAGDGIFLGSTTKDLNIDATVESKDE